MPLEERLACLLNLYPGIVDVYYIGGPWEEMEKQEFARIYAIMVIIVTMV